MAAKGIDHMIFAPRWIATLGIAGIGSAVAVILMVSTRAPDINEPDDLSQDEILGLAATRLMGHHCGILIERSSKADEIEQRAIGERNEKAVAAAEEGLKATDCNELVVRFPDMMTRQGD